jgi:hypothetical protein
VERRRGRELLIGACGRDERSALGPRAVTKGIAVVSLGAAMFNMTLGFYATYKASDPPDPNYKTLAKLVTPQPKLFRATGGVTAREAAAANALLRNTAKIVGNDRAFLTSFEPAQGAYAANDGTWDAQIASVRARIGTVSIPASAGPASAKIDTPASRKAAAKAAQLLRSLAAELDER